VTPSSDQTRSCIDRGFLVFALSLASFSIVMPARLATFSFVGCSPSMMHSSLAFPTFLKSANTLSWQSKPIDYSKAHTNTNRKSLQAIPTGNRISLEFLNMDFFIDWRIHQYA
jgi:hypothetical protein